MVMLVSLVVRSSSTPMVVGVPMVVVLSLGKIQPRLTGVVHTS
uniref:S-adenosyl-L-methionine synthetase n=1 Tax=Capsicum annuum TaxID=4072 RepID=Q6RK03_CAPAN|nr:S-adenosyl-L-methionine synthetase [Capsicum annuum]